MDLVPTVLDALGPRVPRGARRAGACCPARGPRRGRPPPGYFEAISTSINRRWAPLYGLRDGALKYVDLPLPELYDLGADPAEARNLAASRPQDLERLGARLDARCARATAGVQPARESPRDARAAARARLRRLRRPPPPKERYTADDDPKRLIELDAKTNRDAVPVPRGPHRRGDRRRARGDRAPAGHGPRPHAARLPRARARQHAGRDRGGAARGRAAARRRRVGGAAGRVPDRGRSRRGRGRVPAALARARRRRPRRAERARHGARDRRAGRARRSTCSSAPGARTRPIPRCWSTSAPSPDGRRPGARAPGVRGGARPRSGRGAGPQQPRRDRGPRGPHAGGRRALEAGGGARPRGLPDALQPRLAALRRSGRREEARPYLEAYLRDAPGARGARHGARAAARCSDADAAPAPDRSGRRCSSRPPPARARHRARSRTPRSCSSRSTPCAPTASAATATRGPRRPRSTRSPARASLFEDAFSHCPLTLPAHASLFTGLLPPRHGVRDNLGFTLERGAPHARAPLPGRGLRHGRRGLGLRAAPRDGIAAGFTLWDDALETGAAAEAVGELQRDGAVATEALARWIEAQGGRRFFAFLHLYEPHAPYAPPATQRRHADPYDGEVAYADELVGRLLERLRSAGVYDRALIAVTSDHGEGLMDHGEQEHGFFLYREALQVPLILRLPGGRKAGTRVAGCRRPRRPRRRRCSISPGCPPTGMDGVSLRGAIDERPDARAAGLLRDLLPAPPLRLERAAVGHRGPLPLSSAAPRSELYDRVRDPGSSRPRREQARRGRGDGRLARAEGGTAGATAADRRPRRPQGQAGRLRDVPARDRAAPRRARRRSARGPARGGRGQPGVCSTRGRPSATTYAGSGGSARRSRRSTRSCGRTPRTPKRTSRSRGSTPSPAGATVRSSTRSSPRRPSPGRASRRSPRSASTRIGRPRRPPTRAAASRPIPSG